MRHMKMRKSKTEKKVNERRVNTIRELCCPYSIYFQIRPETVVQYCKEEICPFNTKKHWVSETIQECTLEAYLSNKFWYGVSELTPYEQLQKDKEQMR